MNFNLKWVLTLFVITFVYSCERKQVKSFNSEYNIKCIKKEWNISDYFDINETICLETDSNCFISQIDKMVIAKNYIYILDKEAKTVFMFTRGGKYVSKINNVGKDPGEYLNITTIDITNDALYLVVWRARQKLLKYSLNLSFIEETSPPIECGALKIMDEGYYIYASNICDKKLSIGGKHYNLAFFNKQDDLQWYDLPFNDSFCGRSNSYGSQGRNFTLSSTGDLFFTKPFSDEIYKVEKDVLDSYFKLNFNYESIENVQENMNRKEMLNHYNKLGLFKSIGNLCITQSFVYFQIFSNQSFRCIVEDDVAYYTSNSGVDPKFGLNFSKHIGNTSEYNGIIVEVPPIHIKYMCKNKPELVVDEIKELEKNISVNDNPILFFLKYRSE